MFRRVRPTPLLWVGAGLLVGAIATTMAPRVRTMSPLPPVAVAEPTSRSIPPDLLSFAEVAERVSPAVVTVRSEKRVRAGETEHGPFGNMTPEDDPFQRFFGIPRGDQTVRGMGSGFIIDPAGILLTNNHVVQGADKLIVRLQSGREVEGKLVGADPKSDVAVVEIQGGPFPAVEMGSSESLRVGEWVLAIGSPFNQQLEHTVTAGIISAKGRSAVGLADYEDFLQTDAAINPGNSGGPLVNLQGRVIGMNTAIASRSGGYQGIGFAIPIDMAKDIATQLRDNGKVVRSWLGIGINDISNEIARGLELDNTDGVLVSEVTLNSPAEKAGVHEGDVILSMNGTAAGGVAKFRNRVATTSPGTQVELAILRDGKRQTVKARLEEKPEDEVAARSRGGDPGNDKGLGVDLANVTPELVQRFDLEARNAGIVVTRVAAGSPAAEAGMQPGDVVRAVNRKRVANVAEFEAEISRLDPKAPVVLLLRRGQASTYVALERTS